MSDCIPINFSIVGVQKAATSSLYWLLVRHRAVARTALKELHFFDDETRDWDRPDYSEYTATRRTPRQVLACDATPSYLFWPAALPRMQAYAPRMPLLALFRDPVERAFSHWMMQAVRRPATPPFDALVTESLDRGDPHVPPGGWHRGRARSHSMVARGFYGVQLQRGLESFPREQWLMLDFLDLVQDRLTTLDRVTDFLGIPRYREPLAEQRRRPSAPVTASGPGDPSAAVLERLATAYADDLRSFERLSGLSAEHWPTSRLLRGELDAEEWATRLRSKARES